jgi:hypothetical protein
MQMLLPPFKMHITEQLAVHLNELTEHLPVHGARPVNTMGGGGK